MIWVNRHGDNKVTIWRERPATQQEKDNDPEASVITEVVEVVFGDDEPIVTVNRNLCAIRDET